MEARAGGIANASRGGKADRLTSAKACVRACSDGAVASVIRGGRRAATPTRGGHEEESASASTSKQRRETESEKADSEARPTDGSCAPLLPRGRAATACGNLTNGPDLCDLVCL
jgi:hypothetical protein